MNCFDLHCDTLTNLYGNHEELSKNTQHISLEKARVFKNYAQVFALWGGNKPLSDKEARRKLRGYIHFAHEQFRKNDIELVTNYNEFRDCKDNKIRGILSIEGAELLADEEEFLFAVSNGVKIITLTWNFENKYAYPSKHKHKGLLPKGIELLRNMEEHKVICDVSHISERGFYDVLKYSKRPFIASHSCAKSICDHRRNLTDEQIIDIIKSEGLIGINLYPYFLTHEKYATIDDVLRHVDRILHLGGQKNLALGCDFDGVDILPNGIDDISYLPKLFEAIKIRFDIAEDIFWNNAEEFIRKNF